MPETRYACPVCGTVHAHQSERYKNHVCHACETRARCSHDRLVVGYNISPMGGGFEARHHDQTGPAGASRCDQVTADGVVTIDGTAFRMREARFGGVVVTPLPGALIPVAQTVVWSRDGHIEWTSAGNPAPFVGYVGELAGKRRLLGRGQSTFEWMVRKAALGGSAAHTVAQGVASTADEAKDRVVEQLDRMNALLAEQRARGDRRGRDLDDRTD